MAHLDYLGWTVCQGWTADQDYPGSKENLPEWALRGTAVEMETPVSGGPRGREALQDSQGLANQASLETRVSMDSREDQEPLDIQG